MNRAEKARRTVLAVEISADELACRIAEQAIGLRRPIGVSAKAALAQLHATEPNTVDSFYRMAEAAVRYMRECVNAARAPQ